MPITLRLAIARNVSASTIRQIDHDLAAFAECHPNLMTSHQVARLRPQIVLAARSALIRNVPAPRALEMACSTGSV